MAWIDSLQGLPVGVAFAVVFVIGLWLVVRIVLKHLIGPITKSIELNTDSVRELVENHLQHHEQVIEAQTREFARLSHNLEEAMQCLFRAKERSES